MQLKIHDTLYPMGDGRNECQIIGVEYTDEKMFYRVRYTSGKIRLWSKTHIRKYYSKDPSKMNIWEKLNDE